MNQPADRQDKAPEPTPKRYDYVKTSTPSTFAQWQLVCAFVKHLYLQGSYESCISKTEDLFKAQKIHDVHRVFLHFYAGLSYETLAESLGSEHNDFHAQLDGAEQHLLTAFRTLPIPQSKPATTHLRHGSYEAFKRELASQQRSSSESSRPDTDLQSQRNSKSSQTTPGSPGYGGNADEDTCLSGSRGRYNRILMSLKPELEAHISYIQALRQDSTEAISRSNSHAGNSEELRETMAKIAIKQRVASGRKRNWKRTRFSLIPQASSRIPDISENQ